MTATEAARHALTPLVDALEVILALAVVGLLIGVILDHLLSPRRPPEDK